MDTTTLLVIIGLVLLFYFIFKMPNTKKKWGIINEFEKMLNNLSIKNGNMDQISKALVKMVYIYNSNYYEIDCQGQRKLRIDYEKAEEWLKYVI